MENTGKFHGSLTEYEIFSQDGQYFIRYWDEKIKNGGFLPLISERDPNKEALRILGSFRLQKGLLAVVIGAGSIYLLKLLVESKQKSGGLIVVFEADTVLFEFLKNIFPDIFNEVVIYSPGYESDFLEFIDTIDIEQMMGYRFLPHARCMQLDNSFYLEAQNLFKTTFSTRFSDLLTRIEFESRWILNSFLNLPALTRAKAVRNLFNSGEGQSALIVSSGPSLRESLQWIKKNEDKFFICCVDSAYRVLHRSGINPNLIFTLDSQIFTYKHFQGLPKGKKGGYPVLYADFVSNPKVVREWEGDLFMGVTAQYSDTHRVITPGCDYIEEEFLAEPCGDLQSGGSVATSIFDLLRNMNFKSISLIGQDLGFTNREIHCTGTHHTDIWQSKSINRFESFENINNKVLKKRHIVWGKSIKGNKLPEDFIFSMYKKWFEESIEKVPMEVFNETADGGIIQHIGKNPQEYKSLSSDFKNKITNILFNVNNPILKKEFLNQKLRKILSIDPDFSGVYPEELRFLHRIGKKYYIKYLRCKIKENPVSESNCDLYLKLQKKEHAVFWKFFSKSMGNLLNRLE